MAVPATGTVVPATATAAPAADPSVTVLSYVRLRDTIAALSTPQGRGAIGVIRLSGTEALRIATTLVRFPAAPTPRRATLGELVDDSGSLVDEVLATYYAAPKSYTSEDVVEIACHGSPAILRHALDRAVRLGARLAEPGEFTLRAFANGRIDLTQAEAVRELIDSTTLHQARIAVQQTRGSVSRLLSPIKAQLIELIALLEAGIDFAEDDISVAPSTEILRRLDPIIQATGTVLESFAYGSLVRNGFTLAIVGRPNAGKSSLFNRLLGQDRAIVTEIPGTTRDLISEHLEIGGIPVRLVDTAGIRDTGEVIERLGIERSRQAMADADITLVVVDASQPRCAEDESFRHLAAESGRCILVANKSDSSSFSPEAGEIPVSALTGEGIHALRNAILGAMSVPGNTDLQNGVITNIRHQNFVRETLAMLEKARSAVESALPHEFLLLDLYCALRPLDEITGATTADDILYQIFSTFCIGK